MVSPFLSRIPRVSLVFFVAFSILVRLTVPLVSQLLTPSASASISVFPGGVLPLHVILGCLFPRFLWVPSREGIYLFWSLCPRIHLFPVRRVGRSLGSNRLLIKSSTRTLFTEASFSLLVLRAIPAVLCLPPVTTFRFVAMCLGRCSSVRTAVLSSHSWSTRGSVTSVTVSTTPVTASVLVPSYPRQIARVLAPLITTLGRRSRDAYQLYIRTPPHVLSSVAPVFAQR